MLKSCPCHRVRLPLDVHIEDYVGLIIYMNFLYLRLNGLLIVVGEEGRGDDVMLAKTLARTKGIGWLVN